MKMVRASVCIRGLVQGVSFRYHTCRTAQALQVNGWVRNLPGGDVEAVFEGPMAAVQQIVDWCRRGPDSARVEEIDIRWQEYRGEFAGFEVRR